MATNNETLAKEIACLTLDLNLPVGASTRICKLIIEYLKDKVIIISSRQDIERYIGFHLTDEQWESLVDRMQEEMPDEDVVTTMAKQISVNEDDLTDLEDVIGYDPNE